MDRIYMNALLQLDAHGPAYRPGRRSWIIRYIVMRMSRRSFMKGYLCGHEQATKRYFDVEP